MHKRCGFNICFLNRIIRRKIRLIENNATCRYLKQLTCKGTLRQVFEGHLPSYDLILPLPLHTVYAYLFTQGRGGGELTRKKTREATQPVENTNMTDCIFSL